LNEGTYAYFLAQNYRRHLFLNDINVAPLFYSPVIIFKLANGEKFHGQTILCGECMMPNISGSVVDPDKDFVKYTNNGVFKRKGHDVIASFSHFTYHITDGLLLVNDLQGYQNILIDPAIQSLNTDIFKSDTNLKDKSMWDYFSK
jgi:hypothetical protein